jgi:hypothetical protein
LEPGTTFKPLPNKLRLQHRQPQHDVLGGSCTIGEEKIRLIDRLQSEVSMSDDHYLDSYLSEILPTLGLDAETYAPYVTGYVSLNEYLITPTRSTTLT